MADSPGCPHPCRQIHPPLCGKRKPAEAGFLQGPCKSLASCCWLRGISATATAMAEGGDLQSALMGLPLGDRCKRFEAANGVAAPARNHRAFTITTADCLLSRRCPAQAWPRFHPVQPIRICDGAPFCVRAAQAYTNSAAGAIIDCRIKVNKKPADLLSQRVRGGFRPPRRRGNIRE